MTLSYVIFDDVPLAAYREPPEIPESVRQEIVDSLLAWYRERTFSAVMLHCWYREKVMTTTELYRTITELWRREGPDPEICNMLQIHEQARDRG